MAVTIQETNIASYRIPLTRNGNLGPEETSRTISIPNVNMAGLSAVDFDTALSSFRTELSAVTNYETAFQPTTWRDADILEDAWTLNGGVSAITLEITSTRKSTII